MRRGTRWFLLLHLLVVVAALGLPSVAFAKPQETCPCDGVAIDRDVSTDVGDKRVYFCSYGCKAAFLANPQKYLAKLEKEEVELETCTPEEQAPAKPGRPSLRPHLAGTTPPAPLDTADAKGAAACVKGCDDATCGCAEGKACGCKVQEGVNDCRQAFVPGMRVCECEW